MRLSGVEDMANLLLASRDGKPVGTKWARRFVDRATIQGNAAFADPAPLNAVLNIAILDKLFVGFGSHGENIVALKSLKALKAKRVLNAYGREIRG
ncbi:hypothetical protein F5883DRAFT_716770 [Diaporthe sp. PMI_573]|nr:hypothetical protein F5883DRAFT_716770 [Diaporthaceae sp. PMI_573]